MKYKVIGWVDCYGDGFKRHKNVTACVERAIIEEIRAKGYRFGGDAHENFCPVLNDGTFVSYSWRGWGAVMARAWNADNSDGYAYALFYMDDCIPDDERKYPPEGADESLIVYDTDEISETFEMHLNDEPFLAIKEGRKTVEVRLYDNKRKLIDVGDYIIFCRATCPEEKIKAKIVSLNFERSFEELFTGVAKDYGVKTDTCSVRPRFPLTAYGAEEGTTVEQLVATYRKIYGKDKERKYGVLAIEIKLV